MKAKVTARKPIGDLTLVEQERSLRALGISDAELRLWKAISDGVLEGDIISTDAQARHQSRSYAVYNASSVFPVYVEGMRQDAHHTTSPKFGQLNIEGSKIRFSHTSGSACNTNQYALRV